MNDGFIMPGFTEIRLKDIHWLPATEASQIMSKDITPTIEALARAEELWGSDPLITKFHDLLIKRGPSLYDYTIEDHFTASAIIYNPSNRSILMTFHPWYKLWLQLGGHDKRKSPSYNPVTVSAIEALEESGINDLWICDWPIRIDPHSAHQCRSAENASKNHHYDICYMLVTTDTKFKISDESIDMSWISYDKLIDLVATGQAQQRALDMMKNALILYEALSDLNVLPDNL